MLQTNFIKSPIIAQAAFTERLRAFAVTSLAFFILASLVWPLTVSQFRSVAGVQLFGNTSHGAPEQFKSELLRFVKEETSDQRLESIVAQIETAGPLDSNGDHLKDFDAIRRSLQVGLNTEQDGYQFLIGLDGNGSTSEQELINILTSRIAFRLNPEPNPVLSQNAPANLLAEDPYSMKNFQSATSSRLDEATWIIDQIESDLDRIKYTVGLIGSGGTVGQPQLNSNDSPFQYASSKNILVETEQLTSVLDSIDVKSLRSVLIDIRERTAEQVAVMNQDASKIATEDRLVVTSLEPPRTVPVNGTPSRISLVLLSLVSLVIGAAISLRVDPFFEKGFDNPDAIEKSLGVPVVAILKASPIATEPNSPSWKESWANRLTKSAGLFLFGVFVLVAGFILVNSEVRTSFFENPFFGFAKIVRIFAGY